MLWKPDVSLTPRGCQMTSEEWLDEVRTVAYIKH